MQKTDKHGFLLIDLVTKETYVERITICRQCDQFRTQFRTCKQCNCFMPMKARHKNSTCPLNKW